MWLSYSHFHSVSLTHTRDFTLALNQLNEYVYSTCICVSVQYVWICARSVVCIFCFLSVFYGLSDIFPAVCTLSINSEWKGEKEQGRTGREMFLSFLTFPQRGVISLVKWHKWKARIRVLLSVSWQNIKIHSVTETYRRNHRSLWDTRNSSLRKTWVCVWTVLPLLEM